MRKPFYMNAKTKAQISNWKRRTTFVALKRDKETLRGQKYQEVDLKYCFLNKHRHFAAAKQRIRGTDPTDAMLSLFILSRLSCVSQLMITIMIGV